MNEVPYEPTYLDLCEPERDAAYAILELHQAESSNADQLATTYDVGPIEPHLPHFTADSIDYGAGQLEEPYSGWDVDAQSWTTYQPYHDFTADDIEVPVSCSVSGPWSEDTLRSVREPSYPESVSTANGQYRCEYPECSSTSFSRRADLARHKRTRHSENKMPHFPCPFPQCSRVNEFGFKREDHLTQHLRSVHGQSDVESTPHFGRPDSHLNDDAAYTQRETVSDTYVAPARTRTRPRLQQYTCDQPYCSKTYDRACDLKRHKKMHADRAKRPHKCSICGQGFLYPKDKIRHEKSHGNTSELRYRCSVEGCPRNELSQAFAHIEDLERHIEVIHAGTDAHALTSSVKISCRYCNLGFSRVDNLRRHTRKQHPDKTDEALRTAVQMNPVVDDII